MSTYYCRLCLINSKPEDSLLFSKYISDIIQFCIPEVDLKLVNNPILCAECYDRLEQMLKFKKKCMVVQDNIKKILGNNEGCEGIDLNKSLFDTIISSTTNDPETPAPNQGNEIVECKAESSVVSENTLNVGCSSILNCSSFNNIRDEIMNSTESSVDIKTEVDVTTSTVCDSANNLQHTPPHVCEKQVAKSVSRKLKILKNVLDVKFTNRYCHPCRLPFNNLTEIIFHLYSKHQKDGELYACLLCRYKSSKLAFIRKHYSTSHIKCSDLNASCIFCLTHKENFGELFTHMLEKHSNICKLSRYFCNSCDFRTKSYVNFRKHYFLSHDLICNYCSRYCEDVSSLNRHLRTHFAHSKKYSTVEFKTSDLKLCR